MEKLRFRFLETSKFLLADTGTPKGVPAKPQIEVCNQRFDGIWNPKNLKKHRFGPETSKSNPRMERVLVRGQDNNIMPLGARVEFSKIPIHRYYYVRFR